MNQLKLHYINSSGLLDSQIPKLENAVERVVEESAKHFKFKDIDVVVYENPYFVIPEIGLIGITSFRGDSITVTVDSSRKIPQIEFDAMLFHELHHGVRFQKMDLEFDTINRIISEGLACAYEEEMIGRRPIYSKVPLNDELIKKLRSTNHDGLSSEEWLYGNKDIPKWVGYSYGYELAKKYEADKELHQHKLVYEKAETIWDNI